MGTSEGLELRREDAAEFASLVEETRALLGVAVRAAGAAE